MSTKHEHSSIQHDLNTVLVSRLVSILMLFELLLRILNKILFECCTSINTSVAFPFDGTVLRTVEPAATIWPRRRGGQSDLGLIFVDQEQRKKLSNSSDEPYVLWVALRPRTATLRQRQECGPQLDYT